VSSFTLYLLGMVNLAVGIYALRASMAYYRYSKGALETTLPPQASRPSVALLIPCCGAESGLEENLRSLTELDYQPLEIVFIVEDETDSAVPVIRRAMEATDRPTVLVISGSAERCGQKVHNLKAGLARAQEAEVFAFADSDGFTDRAWLASLVAALEKPNVGVASSYRFYLPEPGSLGSLLRSAWNAGVLTLLGEHDHNFAWGGAMVIRKETFDRAGVDQAWKGALSDDYALTHAVRRAGYRVAFVPQSIVVSKGSMRLGEVLEWCARQMAITRVYWPNLWRLGGGSQVAFVLFLLGGGQATLAGNVGVTAILASLLLLSWVSGALRAEAVRLLLPKWDDRLRRYQWLYILLAPFTSLLTVYGFLASVLSRRIRWRGKVYEMRSPKETVIIHKA